MANALSNSAAKIDFSLAPEPTRYERALAGACSEHEQWRAAMNEEIDIAKLLVVFPVLLLDIVKFWGAAGYSNVRRASLVR